MLLLILLILSLIYSVFGSVLVQNHEEKKILKSSSSSQSYSSSNSIWRSQTSSFDLTEIDIFDPTKESGWYGFYTDRLNALSQQYFIIPPNVYNDTFRQSLAVMVTDCHCYYDAWSLWVDGQPYPWEDPSVYNVPFKTVTLPSGAGTWWSCEEGFLPTNTNNYKDTPGDCFSNPAYFTQIAIINSTAIDHIFNISLVLTGTRYNYGEGYLWIGRSTYSNYIGANYPRCARIGDVTIPCNSTNFASWKDCLTWDLCNLNQIN